MKYLHIKSNAFTLAEVLITLGIIGVVAALTLSTVISNYNKSVIESRLKNFYSIMNQAVKMSEVNYGEFQYWDVTTSSSDKNAMKTWWNTYFAPHVKTLKTENSTDGNGLWVYLVDGTKFKVFNYYGESTTSSSTHIFFYPKAQNITNINGKDYFTFFMHTNTNKNTAVIEPYKFAWDGTEEHLKNGTYGCFAENENSSRHYCTALIQYHNWKIPEDYPYKF